jgi:hypothetical protein
MPASVGSRKRGGGEVVWALIEVSNRKFAEF